MELIIYIFGADDEVWSYDEYKDVELRPHDQVKSKAEFLESSNKRKARETAVQDKIDAELATKKVRSKVTKVEVIKVPPPQSRETTPERSPEELVPEDPVDDYEVHDDYEDGQLH